MEFVGWFVVIPGAVGPHELMHLCVLVALACHWRFVYQFAADNPYAGCRGAVGRNGWREANEDLTIEPQLKRKNGIPRNPFER
jgi:hypothetical protein